MKAALKCVGIVMWTVAAVVNIVYTYPTMPVFAIFIVGVATYVVIDNGIYLSKNSKE